MQILVHLDAARLFRWHLALVQLVADDGHEIIVSFEDRSEPLPSSLTALFDYDRARSGAGEDRLSTPIKSKDFAAFRSAEAPGGEHISLDLATASFISKRHGRTLRPLFDGSYKDYALFHALLDRRAPHLSVSDSIGRDAVWDIGLPAIETPWRIGASFDQVSSRLAEGLRRTIARIAAGGQPDNTRRAKPLDVSTATVLSSASNFAVNRATRKLGRALEKVSGETAKWHVAWRSIDPASPPRPELLDLNDFTILPDDGKRYYADPFVFVHGGTRHIFVEELPEATGRGIISHFTLAGDGRASRPRPILDTGFHLSYPFVFEEAGDIWMLPESVAAGGLDLYRAHSLPDVWKKEARLIEGRVHDATFFKHGGTFWIAAGSETLQSATWDGLSLYSASSLTGPWTPHAGNPVLVDARCARPAGALLASSDGHMIRPAQDCSQAYGGGLALRRLSHLDEHRLAEETVGTIAFAQAPKILGPHTLSRGGGLELVDLFAKPSALRTGSNRPAAL